MNKLQIALLQIMPEDNIQKSILKGIEYCKKAKAIDADIALFPEMWSCGYNIPQDINQLKALSIDSQSEFVTAFKKLSKELNMAIGITYLERWEPSPRNTMCLFDRHGNSVLTYAKVHTCDDGEERILTPGDDFYVTDLDTVNGIVKVGSMICYDREVPESARILMLKGAEIILVPNACPMETNRLSQLKGRAYENMVGIATANYPRPQPDCNGHSSAFDGIAYRPDGSGQRDSLVIEAGEEEGIYCAVFNMDELRTYRKQEIHGNAFRHPSKYSLLVSKEKNDPFIRKNYRE